MMLLKFFLLLLTVLKYVFGASISSAVLFTGQPDMEIIVFEFPGNVNAIVAGQHITNFASVRDFSTISINAFIQRLLTTFPGSSFHILSVSSGTLSEEQYRNIFGHTIRDESLMPRDLEEWKRSAIRPSEKLPIQVRRSSIIPDAVQAYKNLANVAPNHLFNRNIKVTFVDEAGEDYGGLRNEFFSLFFREIIETSRLFALNSEGYVILATQRMTPDDLVTYEAFGFYLAKAFQNNVSIGCHFAQIIVEFIKFGRLQFSSLDLLESWDSQFSAILRNMEFLPADGLNDYNFNDINPEHPSLAVTPDNVHEFAVQKFRNEIIQNFQVQLMMIALGFVRACPGNLIANSDLDLAEVFRGKITLTADELISAFSVEGPRSMSILRCFVQWLRSLNPDQLMKFFNFVTGMRVIPPGSISNLNLKIIFLAPGTEHKLPQANTCQKFLMLPPYETEQQAMERFGALLRHLESGDAFGFGFA